MASHITLKSASDFIRNVLSKATKMTSGQATYFLCQVLKHAKAVADSERVQIPSFPEKELLLPSLADNPALCLALTDHPLSPVPSLSVGLAQALSLGSLSPSHPGGLTSSVFHTKGDLIPLTSSTPLSSLPELKAIVPESFRPCAPSNPFISMLSGHLGQAILEVHTSYLVLAPTFSKISRKLLQSTPPTSSHPSSVTLGKQTTQHSATSLSAEVHIEPDVIDMTVPMESPSSADGGLYHKHRVATKEVLAADTTRNIQAYMGLIQMTHVTTQETSAAPIESNSSSVAATTGAAQQVTAITTSVPTIQSASASGDVTPPPLVKPSTRSPKRSSSSKSKSSSSKPFSSKELKSSSCPQFTHHMYHLDSDDVKLEHDARHLWKDSCKLSEYWNDSHQSQDVLTWYFMTVTQTNPNTPIHLVNKFAHADKICLEKKHS